MVLLKCSVQDEEAKYISRLGSLMDSLMKTLENERGT
jgi:hypothetical protein